MWRHESWHNPHDNLDDKHRLSEAYEKGADVMLKSVVPVIEQELRLHTSAVSFNAIINGDLWKQLKSD